MKKDNLENLQLASCKLERSIKKMRTLIKEYAEYITLNFPYKYWEKFGVNKSGERLFACKSYETLGHRSFEKIEELTGTQVLFFTREVEGWIKSTLSTIETDLSVSERVINKLKQL